MTKQTNANAQALPQPPLPAGPTVQAGSGDITHTAGNASRLLEKPRVRGKAHADQATLQAKGPNALPVSDYPLKKGPVAANTLDLREQERSRARQK